MNFIFLKEKQKILPYIFGGFLFLTDRIFKWLATVEGKLPYFGNQGLIFSLPIAPFFALLINILILGAVFFVWRQIRHPSFILIIIGGASNLLDRLVHGAVIDYIFIIPMAPANLADAMIVAGIIWYFWEKRKNLSS